MPLPWFLVVTADQTSSQRSADLVPAALAELDAIPSAAGSGLVLPFERTVGDEIQGVLDSAGLAVDVALRLSRSGQWAVGVGVGSVELPLAASTRAARGPAFVAAREAVEAARRRPQGLAVRAGGYADDHGVAARHAELAEAGLWLLLRVRHARTVAGWEVSDLLATHRTQRDVATTLDVSPAAISQRVRNAGLVEEWRGVDLVVHHLAACGAELSR